MERESSNATLRAVPYPRSHARWGSLRCFCPAAEDSDRSRRERERCFDSRFRDIGLRRCRGSSKACCFDQRCIRNHEHACCRHERFGSGACRQRAGGADPGQAGGRRRDLLGSSP